MCSVQRRQQQLCANFQFSNILGEFAFRSIQVLCNTCTTLGSMIYFSSHCLSDSTGASALQEALRAAMNLELLGMFPYWYLHVIIIPGSSMIHRNKPIDTTLIEITFSKVRMLSSIYSSSVLSCSSLGAHQATAVHLPAMLSGGESSCPLPAGARAKLSIFLKPGGVNH